MYIEIRNRWDNKVILCGEYESVKDCLEKNRIADLSKANLSKANLSKAYLFGADLSGADLSKANLSKAYLFGADLSGANLSGANLFGADLSKAYLFGADLSGAKNYVNSHDFWAEIIRRQPLETFTEKEWGIIGQVYVHRLCWESIIKRYGKKIMPIFEKLSKAGFGEWSKVYKEKLKE